MNHFIRIEEDFVLNALVDREPMLGNQHRCVWLLLLVRVMIRAAWFSIRCTFAKSVVLILE